MSQWAIGRLRVGVFSHRDAAKGPSVQHSEAQNLHARIGGTRQEQTKNGNDVMERNAAGLPALIATAATPAVRKLDRIDVCVARPARVRNFLGGGEANFESDRRAIEYAAGDMPGGMEAARATVRSLGTFMVRAVRYLGGECGVRQYMNLGTPIPTADDVHVVAQHMAPESRIMYFGNDPVVMAHAHSLRRSTRDGVAGYVHTKLRHPDELLEKAAATLDFASPVAVMLLGTLAFVPDEHDPHGIVAKLQEALPAGSYLVVAHTTDLYKGVTEAAERLSETLGEPFVVRSRARIARFFDGLDIVKPGLVQIDQWRPDPNAPPPDMPYPVPILTGIGCKP
jgi:hypothetical protein